MITLLLIISSIFPSAHGAEKLKSIRLGLEFPSIQYKIRDIQDEGKEFSDQLKYIPNSKSFLVLSLGFSNFTASLSVENPDDNKKENLLPPTEIFDIQLIGIYKRFLWEAFYQNYQGLFVQKQSSEADTDTDLKTANSYSYGFEVTYFNKRNYKPTHTLSNFKFKKITGWSTFQKIKLNRQNFSSNNGLVPNDSSENFNQVKDLESITTSGLGYEFGVMLSYSKKFFFSTFSIGLGPILYNQNVTGIAQGDRYLTKTTSSVLLDIGVKNSKNMVWALQTRIDNNEIPIKNVLFERTRAMLTLSYKYYLD